MSPQLKTLLQELETFGKNNDATHTERSQRMLNITPDTGELLNLLIRATAAKHILEVGTSNGYSTLWLAHAAQATAGHVTTLELSEQKQALAIQNFQRAGLSDFITPILGEAGQQLTQFPNASFDLIFLDSERTEYPAWWPHIKRTLRAGGLLVVDHATSHPQEMAPLIKLVAQDPEFTSTTIAVGNGEFLATKK